MKRMFLVLLITLLPACANFSQFMNDQPIVAQIAVKDSVVLAIGLSTKDEGKRQEYAKKLVAASDGALAAIGGEQSLTKEKILEILDRELAKQDMEFFMKMVVQDVILVLDNIYPVEVPTVTIPEEYREDVKKVFEYMKKGASIFITE